MPYSPHFFFGLNPELIHIHSKIMRIADKNGWFELDDRAKPVLYSAVDCPSPHSLMNKDCGILYFMNKYNPLTGTDHIRHCVTLAIDADNSNYCSLTFHFKNQNDMLYFPPKKYTKKLIELADPNKEIATSIIDYFKNIISTEYQYYI